MTKSWGARHPHSLTLNPERQLESEGGPIHYFSRMCEISTFNCIVRLKQVNIWSIHWCRRTSARTVVEPRPVNVRVGILTAESVYLRFFLSKMSYWRLGAIGSAICNLSACSEADQPQSWRNGAEFLPSGSLVHGSGRKQTINM